MADKNYTKKNNIAPEEEVTEALPENVEVVGINFREAGKIYYFSPKGIKFAVGNKVIVETSRGVEMGTVKVANKVVPSSEVVPPLKSVTRLASAEDLERDARNHELELDAALICKKKIAAHKLEMSLVATEYTFDNSKLIFYFTSAGRVDFRELVKDLASVFRIRIELRQIGIRDEAKLMGGLGVCGRPLCCASFLSDFVQVSIKMAKEQSLSLNSTKISGTCGRLMCCLRYEYDTYQEEISRTPPVDSVVDTPDGRGTVIEISPLAGNVKVRIVNKQETLIKTFKRDLCTVVSKSAQNEEKNN